MNRLKWKGNRLFAFAYKGSAWLAALMVCCALLAVAVAYLREHRQWVAPLPELSASTDPVLIERGRYLANGPGHCSDCHAPLDWRSRVDQGKEAPLSGGYGLKIFLGQMVYPNITPDSETGLGRISDQELARFFRYGVDHRGEVGLPFMMYADLSDTDLVAILSYLRSMPAVHHAVPASRYNILGKVTKAFFLEPFAPKQESIQAPPRGRTREYGGYLANDISNCASCHTERNMHTGDYIGPRFAGGMIFHKDGDPTQVALSPNLTPDPQTGVLAAWSEEAFIHRFKAGNLGTWSPMPWGPFSRMTEDDLGALYLYLKSLEPIKSPIHP